MRLEPHGGQSCAIRSRNVLPKKQDIPEADFHRAKLAGLERAEKAVGGEKVLADVMRLTRRQLGNIKRGGSTHPQRIWDALAADRTALDDIAALYDVQVVARNAEALDKPATLSLAQLLTEIAKAESPDSDGGTRKTHRELIGMETLIREVHALTAGWIEQINAHRAPTTG